MRRISSRFVTPSLIAARSIASASFTAAEIAKAEGVAEANLKKLNPRTYTWIGLDVVARQKLKPFTDTIDKSIDYARLYNEMLASAPKTIPAGSKEALKNAKDLPTLLKAYAGVLGPVKQLKKLLDAEELEQAYLKDRLKIGLTSFKQAQLDEAKSNLVKIDAAITKYKAEIAAIGKENFTTESFNDIVNACRIAGLNNIATRMLDDMTLLSLPFNETTKMLLNNVVFGDGPLEDSGMLFAFVEYPERGEVFATKSTDLDAIATHTLKVISERHQTPLDSGRKLQKPDTHPCLQRSLE